MKNKINKGGKQKKDLAKIKKDITENFEEKLNAFVDYYIDTVVDTLLTGTPLSSEEPVKVIRYKEKKYRR